MPKVSIIVPVYGVEKYIERCARSLFEQTFDDIEYIFVNDCTKDDSIEVLESIIKEYPHRKGQVNILHHEVNKGLPQARKTGILAATGDYLINFDSDDWVEFNTIEVLYNKAKQEGADIVICDYYTTNDDEKDIVRGCISMEKGQFVEDLCLQKISWSLCNKMFNRLLFDDKIIYPVYNQGEDMALTLQLILKSNIFVYISEPLYYYYCNVGSISKVKGKSATLNRYFSFKQNTEIVIKVFRLMNLSEKYKDIIIALKWNVKKSIWNLTHVKEYFEEWKLTYSEINFTMLSNPQINITDKFKYILTYLRLYPKKKDRIF